MERQASLAVLSLLSPPSLFLFFRGRLAFDGRTPLADPRSDHGSIPCASTISNILSGPKITPSPYTATSYNDKKVLGFPDFVLAFGFLPLIIGA